MRFLDDGRMLYSLETLEPEDMAKVLKKGISLSKRVFEGSYSICRNEVLVEVISGR